MTMIDLQSKKVQNPSLEGTWFLEKTCLLLTPFHMLPIRGRSTLTQRGREAFCESKFQNTANNPFDSYHKITESRKTVYVLRELLDAFLSPFLVLVFYSALAPTGWLPLHISRM